MEFVSGGNLKDWINQKKELSVDQVEKLLIDLCQLLVLMKQQRIHGNVKPETILVRSDSELVLSNFELPKENFYSSRMPA